MIASYKEQARKYAPSLGTKILFVAEAPPCSMDRYFYFEDILNNDWLWIALMKGLYRKEWTTALEERPRKRQWLERFRGDRFSLIDAVKEPTSGSSRSRVLAIQANADKLIEEIRLINPERIVLVKTTVHDALAERFLAEGLPLANRGPLPFPSSGQQARFHSELQALNLGKR